MFLLNIYLHAKPIIKTLNYTVDVLFHGIREGNITLLSKAITYLESRNAEKQAIAAELLDKCLPCAGNSIRIGITGVPGVGKSTFIDAFGKYIVEHTGKRIAVLAIDPSSKLSKGSILGDKTRMEYLSVHRNVFIRPSASGDTLGGIALRTKETIVLCESAGYEYILVETVGVGQSETAVSNMTDCFLLLMLSGAGDELQGVKRGIMEMADVIYITKADGENKEKAKQRAQEIRSIIHFLPQHQQGYIPQVNICSAYDSFNIHQVYSDCMQFIHQQKMKSLFDAKRRQQDTQWMQNAIEETCLNEIIKKLQHNEMFQQLQTKVRNNEISIFTAQKAIAEILNKL